MNYSLAFQIYKLSGEIDTLDEDIAMDDVNSPEVIKKTVEYRDSCAKVLDGLVEVALREFIIEHAREIVARKQSLR